MRKAIITAFLVFSVLGIANAQMSKDIDWKDKVFIGGNFGVTFGSYTNVNVSPMIGYKFTDKTLAGISLTYQYVKDSRYAVEFSSSIYGAGLWGRQFVTDNIFLHAEYELLNYEKYFAGKTNERAWLGTGLVGGGYRYELLYVTALYILNHNTNNSPYGTVPYVIRIGVGF